MPIPKIVIEYLIKDKLLAPYVYQFSDQLDPIILGENLFQGLTESIISQQISIAAAKAITTRFRNLFPTTTPTPEEILFPTIDTLKSVGISSRKANYIQNVARFWQENELEGIDWSGIDSEIIIEKLTRIKGVGRWTVEMQLLFGLGLNDIFAIDDGGLQAGIEKVYGISRTLPKKEFLASINQITKPWSPYRSWASRIIWKIKDTKLNL